MLTLATVTGFLDEPIGESPYVVRQILFAVLLPLVIGIVSGWPGSRLRSAQDPDAADASAPLRRDWLAWRVPLALAGSMVLAFLALEGWPDEQWHSLMWAVCAGGTLGMIMCFTPRHMLVRVGMFAVLSLIVTACIWPVIEREKMWVRAIAPISVFLTACLLEPIFVRRRGPSTIFAVGIALATSMVTLVAVISLTTPLPYMAVGMALLGMFFLSLLPGRAVSLGDGAVAVLAPMLVLYPYVIQFYLFSDPKPWLSFALPTAAVAGMWLPELPAIARRANLAAALRIGVVIAICALAGGLTAKWMADEEAGSDDDPYADMYSLAMHEETTEP